MTKPVPALSDFPVLSSDKLRFGDTDAFGHINNAAFSTFFETGRTDLFNRAFGGTGRGGFIFVLASLRIDFLREMAWPGETRVGSVLSRVGNSSLVFEQVLFQQGELCATATGTMVQLDPQSRKPTPLSDPLRAVFMSLSRPQTA